ncbi:tRNA (adenine(37)-N6)-methyltransferase [Trichomycterus rosablanca]|uniref:tRNA (adenine(37)-N6)-methyltransferase n=1 Tax=Trichomycterus rosablanca TaxID=2290929 RepID=UPI002F354485
MSAEACSCLKHVQRLTQQVSVMRKEINNLRKHLDSAVRAHRKQMQSLQSILTDRLSAGTQERRMKVPSSPGSSGTELSLERGHIRTVPIGFISSCFAQKNGTPRQPGVCGSSRASLTVQTSVFNNPGHALAGLQQYSHIWLIFLFHKNGHMSYKAKVKPPRLNGQKVGVYSTRSPHRPNAIGLSLAKLESITGDVLHLSGMDLIAGTPVLDIKPYIPEYDSPLTSTPPDPYTDPQQQQDTDLHPASPEEPEQVEPGEFSCPPEAEEKLTGSLRSEDGALGAVLAEVRDYLQQGALFTESRAEEGRGARGVAAADVDEEMKREERSNVAAWIRNPPVGTLSVRFTPTAERELAQFRGPDSSDTGRPRFQFLKGSQEAADALRRVLAADPRSVYRRKRCADRLFFFSLDTADITCWFGEGFAEVLRVRPVMMMRRTDEEEQLLTSS